MLELTNNIQFQALAISNLGLMGRTPEGKRCLSETLQLDMAILMKSMGDIFEGHDMSFKREAALTALGHLMEVEVSFAFEFISFSCHRTFSERHMSSSPFSLVVFKDVEQKDLMEITLSWFSMIGEKPLYALWSCAKYHCPVVRILAFKAIRNVALLSWGRDALLEDCAGFFEWLV